MNQAERALLSAVMHDSRSIAQTGILPTHFSDKIGRTIWGEILSLHANGEPVDPVTLQGRIKNDPVALQAVGTAMQEAASPKNAGAYAKSVMLEYERREISGIAGEITDGIGNKNPRLAASEAITQLVQLGSADRKSEWDAQSLMTDTLAMIDDAANGGQMGLKTGFSQIDKKLGGWHRGDLIVVGARPAMGKTAFGLGAAINAARYGAKVGVVSAEMDAKSLGLRVASAAAGISVHDARCGRLSKDDWSNLTKASNEVAKLPLRVLEASGWTMGQIVRQAHAWDAIGLDFLVIDYLQRINADKNHDRHDLAVGSIAVQAKTLASTLGIPVMLLAQLSRDVEKREDKRPRMSDLRESGQIEQEADSVLMLYRDHVYNDAASEGDAEIVIEKNRQGPPGFLEMGWLPDTAQWVDPDIRDYAGVA